MQMWNKLSTLWLLAFSSIIGIIGMLLVDGVWDVFFLIVMLLPIIIAIRRTYVVQKQNS